MNTNWRTQMIEEVLGKLNLNRSEAIRKILCGYGDNDLLSYAWTVGVNVDEVLSRAA